MTKPIGVVMGKGYAVQAGAEVYCTNESITVMDSGYDIHIDNKTSVVSVESPGVSIVVHSSRLDDITKVLDRITKTIPNIPKGESGE